MNFPEYRTLAERARRNDRLPGDEFEDHLEGPGWVQKYLDLADRAIQRSKDEEEKYRERSEPTPREWPYGT